MDLLQQLGMVELTATYEQESRLEIQTASDTEILEIQEVLTFLSSFQEKPGFLKGLINLKPVIYQEQLKEIIAQFDYHRLIKELSDLRTHLKNITQHKEKLNQEKQLLAPWNNFNVPLDQIRPTQHCGILLGVLNRRDYSKISEDFKKENIHLFFEIINQDRANIHSAFIYIQKDFERLQAILKNYRFNFITLSHHKCTVNERLFEINREVLIFDDDIQDIKNKIAGLLKQQLKLMAVYDYLVNIKKRQEANKNLIGQQFTFSLSGWVKHKDIPLLEQAVADSFKNLAIFISEPKANEEVPVILENKRIIQPFEFITQIYGMPKYNELDPTPFLAPFFFLYFGFCVSDVGYGAMLVLICSFALKKFKMGPQGRKFFRLFLFCGISTMMIGALTGSWFGNLFDLLADSSKIFLPLKKFKDSLVILDPMREPTRLLGVVMTFGIIQVWFGNILAGIGNIKNKRYLDIVLDQFPMLVFLFGLTGLGLIFLKLFDKTYIGLFKYAALLGGLMLIFTQGRSEKGLGLKLFYGIYNFYNAISGYLSDILSYSRLWALGLVTGVMASTINLIGIQFSQIFSSIVPFINKIGFIKILIGSLVLITIFVCGHMVSFLMNLLGAFVHPVRLQFVEFFSKFFKSGGSAFKPLKVETKYIKID